MANDFESNNSDLLSDLERLQEALTKRQLDPHFPPLILERVDLADLDTDDTLQHTSAHSSSLDASESKTDDWSAWATDEEVPWVDDVVEALSADAIIDVSEELPEDTRAEAAEELHQDTGADGSEELPEDTVADVADTLAEADVVTEPPAGPASASTNPFLSSKALEALIAKRNAAEASASRNVQPPVPQAGLSKTAVAKTQQVPSDNASSQDRSTENAPNADAMAQLLAELPGMIEAAVAHYIPIIESDVRRKLAQRAEQLNDKHQD